jgi:hypothetical protein
MSLETDHSSQPATDNMSLNKRRDAFFMDDGEYDGGAAADYDDDEYVDEDGVAYDDDNEVEQIKYVAKSTARATKSGRASTKGRQLKRWDGKISSTRNITKPKRKVLTKLAVDEDQLLLLYCDYVTTQMGQPMPWNEIAAMFEPRDPASGRMAMTGEAIKQHLAKLRLHREKQGFRVPPKLDRNARRNAAAVQATRLASAFSTPTKKKRAAGGSAAKPSTLLASVSKTKQKKAEKAKKAAGGGVTKPTSAKRGRKTTIESLGGKDYVDDCDIVFDVPLFSIGGDVKSEEQTDDDDLPLSKKSKAKKVGSGLMADTLAIWEGRNAVASPVAASPVAASPVAASPVVASPPHYEGTGSFPLPGIVPSQSENVDWSYSSSGDNSLGSDYPFASEFFNPFGTVAPQSSSSFAGLPVFPPQASGYGHIGPSQHFGMMPLSAPISIPQGYHNSFSQDTMTNPSTSFTSSVTDFGQGQGQVQMDYSQFLNEEYDNDLEAPPPDHLTDAFGNNFCVN